MSAEIERISFRTSELLPPLIPLPALLAEAEEPVLYRIDRLLPTGGRALLAAQFKAGKTTLRDNLVRSVADGTPFLDEFTVAPLTSDRTVVVIDNEMSRGQLRRWLRDQGIGHPERVRVVVLRGQVGKFNLLDAPTRQAWAEALRDVGASFVIFDCLRPVLDALGLDEHRDAGRFLVAFDALLAEADVDEGLLLHHMGHHGERSRGDSRLRDWPDVEWRLLRPAKPGEEPDPADPRYFSAYGRDVDVPEGAVDYDPATRHLSLIGGNRRDAGARNALPDVLAILESEGKLSGREVEKKAAEAEAEHGRDAVRAALKLGAREGLIRTEPGPRNSHLHSVRGSARECAARTEIECASAPIGLAHSLPSDEQSETTSRPAHSAPSSEACLNPSHTPRLTGGTWTCPECDGDDDE